MPELFEKVKKRLKKNLQTAREMRRNAAARMKKRQEAEAFCLSEFWRKGRDS